MPDDLLAALLDADPGDLADVVGALPDHLVAALLSDLGGGEVSASPPPDSPAEQARELDGGYVQRDHLAYLSDRLAAAVERVEAGENQYLVVSMPPRSGKSNLASIFTPVWLLRKRPSWKIGLISHDPTLATSWGRQVRGIIENHGASLGLAIAPDAGAASEWQTTERGGITSRSAPGQSITGRGFNIMIVDDVVKDFAAAHSESNRKAVWDWWMANAQTRLEPPSLVIVIGTRWHEDDFIGRLLSKEYDGDPDEWEVISFPAIAEADDVLGRSVGEPLLSPLIRDETPTQAISRWDKIKRAVGMYAWSALFQQRPAPAQGAIFNVSTFRYWTTNPDLATDDGRVRLVDFGAMVGARWLDSWDMAFKATDQSDYVVGQRWVRHGANRFLVAQTRGRRSFTATLAEMAVFKAEPFGERIHQHLVEDKANGTAIMDTLHDKVAGLKPINPTDSKEARARAITPEVESGNVYLPLPSENPWVLELVSELRAFPTGAHDDQVDALTQALSELRESGSTHISIPGQMPNTALPKGYQRTVAAARSGIRRSPGG